jgi:hypothetical protein
MAAFKSLVLLFLLIVKLDSWVFFFVGFHNFCGFFFLLLNYRCLILNVKNKFKKIKNIYYFNIFLNKITF